MYKIVLSWMLIWVLTFKAICYEILLSFPGDFFFNFHSHDEKRTCVAIQDCWDIEGWRQALGVFIFNIHFSVFLLLNCLTQYVYMTLEKIELLC